MKKTKTIRLTESELHGLIRESIEEIICESRQPLTENLNSDILRKLIQIHGPIRNNFGKYVLDLTQLTDDDLSIKLSPDGRSFKKVPVPYDDYDLDDILTSPKTITFQDGYKIFTKKNPPMNLQKSRQRNSYINEPGEYIKGRNEREDFDPYSDNGRLGLASRMYDMHRSFGKIADKKLGKDFMRNYFTRRSFDRNQMLKDIQTTHRRYNSDEYDNAKSRIENIMQNAKDKAKQKYKDEIEPLYDDRFENGGKKPKPMKNYGGRSWNGNTVYWDDAKNGLYR